MPAVASPLPPGVAFAGFWPRFGAYLLDTVLTTLFFVPAVVVLFTGPTIVQPCEVDDEGRRVFDGTDFNALCERPSNGTIAVAVTFALLALAATAAYWMVLEGRRGQTLGKKALGLRTVAVESGAPIGPGRALGRFAIRLVMGFCFVVAILDYLWMLWDAERQTLHDKVARSYVITDAGP